MRHTLRSTARRAATAWALAAAIACMTVLAPGSAAAATGYSYASTTYYGNSSDTSPGIPTTYKSGSASTTVAYSLVAPPGATPKLQVSADFTLTGVTVSRNCDGFDHRDCTTLYAAGFNCPWGGPTCYKHYSFNWVSLYGRVQVRDLTANTVASVSSSTYGDLTTSLKWVRGHTYRITSTFSVDHRYDNAGTKTTLTDTYYTAS